MSQTFVHYRLPSLGYSVIAAENGLRQKVKKKKMGREERERKQGRKRGRGGRNKRQLTAVKLMGK